MFQAYKDALGPPHFYVLRAIPVCGSGFLGTFATEKEAGEALMSYPDPDNLEIRPVYPAWSRTVAFLKVLSGGA